MVANGSMIVERHGGVMTKREATGFIRLVVHYLYGEGMPKVVCFG